MVPTLRRMAVAAFALLTLAACEQKQPIDFKIVSGSENTVIEPIVQAYCHDHGMNCSFEYKGSLDIGADLAPGANSDADAVWPAASLWIDLFDAHPLIAIAPESLPLIDALQSQDFQAIAWTEHGFRGPLGAAESTLHAASGLTVPQTLTAIVPMPEAEAMLALAGEIASPTTP